MPKMASDHIYVPRASIEDALVSQALMGGDLPTLLALAANFGIESSFVSRVTRIRENSSQYTNAPLMVNEGGGR
jgi:hypothetical protein